MDLRCNHCIKWRIWLKQRWRILHFWFPVSSPVSEISSLTCSVTWTLSRALHIYLNTVFKFLILLNIHIQFINLIIALFFIYNSVILYLFILLSLPFLLRMLDTTKGPNNQIPLIKQILSEGSLVNPSCFGNPLCIKCVVPLLHQNSPDQSRHGIH